jgi:DNA polymerase delta subunit 2
MVADGPPGPFLALVSGLGFGAKEAEASGLAAARERLRELLAGEGGQAAPGAVQKLIVCGGLVLADLREKGSVVAAMAEADAALAKIASIVPTEVMPGHGDPSNLSLPQMPLHPHLFRQSRQLGSAAFRSVSNPLGCELDGVHVLGHSGQPVMDLLRGTRLEEPMGALQLSLEALHLAPTAPDTIPSQPFVDGDPFVIDKVPHILFSGGHGKAEHVFRGHPSGDSGTTCVCVPAFHRQPAVVFVSLRDPRDVRVHELGDITMQDAC